MIQLQCGIFTTNLLLKAVIFFPGFHYNMVAIATFEFQFLLTHMHTNTYTRKTEKEKEIRQQNHFIEKAALTAVRTP